MLGPFLFNQIKDWYYFVMSHKKLGAYHVHRWKHFRKTRYAIVSIYIPTFISESFLETYIETNSWFIFKLKMNFFLLFILIHFLKYNWFLSYPRFLKLIIVRRAAEWVIVVDICSSWIFKRYSKHLLFVLFFLISYVEQKFGNRISECFLLVSFSILSEFKCFDLFIITELLYSHLVIFHFHEA